MADICMDTNVLADFLLQYFSSATRAWFNVSESKHINRDLCYKINSLLNSHHRVENTGIPPFGVLVASAVAFVELARQFDRIFAGQITVEQFAAFLDSPPDFFTIEPLGFEALRELVALPSHCWLGSEERGIEAMDNVHVATARIRQSCHLAATDQRILAAYGATGLLA